MLARLGIRRKLGLLLAIPLAAVVVVMVAYTAERVTDARAADVTARTAKAAREVGGLIQTLQQERLLAMGYLTKTLDPSAYVAKSQEALDEVAALRRDPATAAVLEQADAQLRALAAVRQGVARGTVALNSAYLAYRSANTALLDALRLGRPQGVDATGQGQLAALDALMRSNEEASSVGAILVAAAVNRSLVPLLTDAQIADGQHLRRYRELVAPGQAALIDVVERGQAGQRIRQLAAAISSANQATPGQISDAVTAAITYTDLRRLAQDRVAREIASGAQQRASSAALLAWLVGAGALAVLITVVLLGVTVSRSISRPLRRLTRAAGVVAELSAAELMRVADSDSPDPAPPQLASVDINSADEIGELAAVLNRVQATAALLLERQVSTRRNVSVMFANIARRTQNLVGRQLALIDDLSRNERNPELLQRLYRLDHIATRLRRSADSLLVVSGTIDPTLSGTPTPLADLLRAAQSEIEGFPSVELGEVCEVGVNAAVSADLRLLLAELLENATNFSPPGTPVSLTAQLISDGDAAGDCEIRIVDHGVGIGAARMAEENRRLVERERLDLAPTSVLGLFVVGRLSRRHGMTVRLEPSPERGVTAVVRLPASLFKVGPVPAPKSGAGRRLRAPRRELATVIEVPQPFGSFDWFTPADPAAAGSLPVVGNAAEVAASVADRASVASVTTPSMPVWGDPGPDVPPAPVPPEHPAAEHPAAEHPAAERPAPELPRSPLAPTRLPQPVGGQLARRIPGTHMVDDLRQSTDDTARRAARDPEAERAALNDYVSGLARGADSAVDSSPSRLVERAS